MATRIFGSFLLILAVKLLIFTELISKLAFELKIQLGE
jgi:hypothetical protein